MSDNKNLQQAWIYTELPLRPHPHKFSTYSKFSYEKLPPVPIMDIYKNIHTLKDVKKNINIINRKLQSTTTCRIAVDETDESFYHDQQDCVIWHFNEKDGVYVKTETGKLQVSVSLPEFFSRMHMENEIWWKRTIKYEAKTRFQTNLHNELKQMQTSTPKTPVETVKAKLLEVGYNDEEQAYILAYY